MGVLELVIEVYEGKPGQGKSLRLAWQARFLLARNKVWNKQTGRIRTVATNLKFSPSVIKAYPGQVVEWADPLELVRLKDCDILWDEIATHLDNTQWANLPLEVKRFLQQHRKRGINIYGTTQNFKQIDTSMRRIVDKVYRCRKLWGSANPSPTRPPIKRIWGFILLRSIDPDTFEKDTQEFTGWDLMWIGRKLVAIYDTTQEIQMGEYPPLKHIVRTCANDSCNFRRISHS
jgi:hypothetical protein